VREARTASGALIVIAGPGNATVGGGVTGRRAGGGGTTVVQNHTWNGRAEFGTAEDWDAFFAQRTREARVTAGRGA
jgi:hypothetical protein